MTQPVFSRSSNIYYNIKYMSSMTYTFTFSKEVFKSMKHKNNLKGGGFVKFFITGFALSFGILALTDKLL